MIITRIHIYAYIFVRFLSIIGSYKILTVVPMLYGRSLLFVSFIYFGSVTYLHIVIRCVIF